MSNNNKSIKRIATDLDDSHFLSILDRIYNHRNIKSKNELDYSISQLLPYDKLKGINEAVQLLSQAIKQDSKIVIVGDFDVDGATSTTVAIKALKSMGAKNVDFLVPNRFKFGYGLTPEIVQVAINNFLPDLIVTVDNGISSIGGVKEAKNNGIKVIITDHHLPAESLPEADAIVNPNQPEDKFPSKMLAGVGVIFYVMLALRAFLREQDWFKSQNIIEPNLAELLDLVALGTVADVVPLDHNNRILVSQGLARIRSGHVCHGIKALLNISSRSAERIVASDFGFAVAPRLNAAGRLDDMSLGTNCLLSEDYETANRISQELDQINHTRRDIEADMKEQAIKLLDKMTAEKSDLNNPNSLPYGLCLFNKDFHEGVVGILASRIKDRWHRPVIIFAETDNNELKGSGRSVKGLHIRDALDSIAAKHPDLIIKFGGHAMAAGLSIHSENYDLFASAFNEEVKKHLNNDDLQGLIMSDGELSESELNLQTAEQLRYAGPWGQSFPEPVFDGVFTIINKRIVAEKHLKLTLQPQNSDLTIDAIAFNTTDEKWPKSSQQANCAYRLDVNEFRGQQNLQLMLEHIEPC